MQTSSVVFHASRYGERLWWALPGLIVLLLYWPTLDFGLLWDDRAYLTQGQHFENWQRVWAWATEPFFGYFRPVPLLMLGSEQRLLGGTVAPHLASISIHAANACLVALLAAAVSARSGIADGRHCRLAGLVAGVLYGTHPALIESAAWISSRFDLLATFFGLLALWLDRTLTILRARVVLVSLSLLLALLSKEMALGLLIALPLWHLALLPRDEPHPTNPLRRLQAAYPVYAGVAAALVLYLILVVSRIEHVNLRAPGGIVEQVVLVCQTLGGFLGLVFWPLAAGTPVHPMPAAPGDSGFLALMGLAGLAMTVLALWRIRKPAASAWALGLCFVATLLPVVNLLPLNIGDNILHERYLTLPLAFVAILVGTQAVHGLGAAGARGAIARVIGLALWTCTMVVIVHTSLPYWARDSLLWPWAFERTPHSRTAADLLLETLVRDQRYNEARMFAEQLFSQGEDRRSAKRLIQYAEALVSLEDAEAALSALAEALSRTSEHQHELRAQIYCHSGRIFLDHGELDAAIAHLGRSQRYDQANPDCAYYFAIALSAHGDIDAAREPLDRARRDWSPDRAAEALAQLESFVGYARESAAARGKQAPPAD